jgi:hypothetical protein
LGDGVPDKDDKDGKGKKKKKVPDPINPQKRKKNIPNYHEIFSLFPRPKKSISMAEKN